MIFLNMAAETTKMIAEVETLDGSEKLELGPDKIIIILGAGVVGQTLAAELYRLMGPKTPSMIFVDTRDPRDETSDERCKGCAARVLEKTMRKIAAHFDPEGEVLHLGQSEVIVSLDGTEKILAPNVLTQMGIHIPGGLRDVYPVADLNPDEFGWMTYRHTGPTKLNRREKRREIGSNHALWQLLRHNFNGATQNSKARQQLTFIKGRVNQVDLREDKPNGDKPMVTVDINGEVKTLTADLIISAMGVGGGSVPVLGREPEKVMPERVLSVVKEIVISPRQAQRIYGPKLNRGHMFILDPAGVGSDIQYAMLLPQWIWIENKAGEEIQIPVVTQVLIARKGKKLATSKQVEEFLVPYLPEPEKDEGIDLETAEKNACTCGPAIPISAIPLAATFGPGYMAIGDETGVLRRLKNGIGTGVNIAIMAAGLLRKKGYSVEALAGTAEEIYRLYEADNIIGEKLLEWLDDLVINDPLLSRVVYQFTLLEQHLPQDYQVVLETMKDLTSGAITYEKVVDKLLSRKGRGNIYTWVISETILLIARIWGKPPPEVIIRSGAARA